MFALLFWFAAAAASAAPAIATPQLNELFITDDYPAAALRRGEHGTVAARMKIDASGAVIDCTIARSSGSAVLDETTCAVIRARAHYPQLTDADGRAPLRYDVVRIKWVLPLPEVEPTISRLITLVGPAGKAGPCRSEPKGQYNMVKACSNLLRYLAEDIKRDGPDFYMNNEYLFENGLLPGDEETFDSAMARPEILSAGVWAVAIVVDKDGKVSSCITVREDYPPAAQEACGREAKARYEPLDPTVPNRQPRHAIVYGATMVREIRN